MITLQATWRDMTWEINSKKLTAIENFTTGTKIKKATADDTIETIGTELQEISFNYVVALEVGVNPRKEYETWESKISEHGPLYLNGKRFGSKSVQLDKVSLENGTLDAQGRIRAAKINLHFTEYVNETTVDSTMQIIYKGKDISKMISVNSCTYEMYAESRADELIIRFNDTNNMWDSWQAEQEEQIEIIESAARSGKMYIYSLTPEDGTYVLRALSIPPTAKNKTSKSWENVRLLQLGKEIADRHGLKFESYGIDNMLYEYVQQDSLEDFVFLQARCKLEGAAFLVFDGCLVMYDEKSIERETPIKEITLSPDRAFECNDNTTKSYGAAEVINGAIKGEFTADGAGSQVLRKVIKQRISNQAEGNRFARALLRNENKNQYTGATEMEIKHDIAAGSVVKLATTNAQSWEGSAFIYKIRHDFVNRRSKLFLRKPLEY